MSAQATSPFAQSRAALVLANRKRLAQAAVKQALKTKRLTLAEAFEEEAAKEITVSRLMECVPYLTPAKAATVLLIAQVGYSRPVGKLRPRDRWAIMHLLAERHPNLRVRP